MASYEQIVTVSGSASSGQIPQSNGSGGYSWVTPAPGVSPSSVTPAMDGTAAIGTSVDYARADHVHPTDTSRAASSHAHGNITNAGAITATGVALASGDTLAFVDSSDSSKIKKTSISFDGSTTTQALTKKGTFETFLTSHQDISALAPKASPALTGTPTAPTASAGTSTTQIATTAFVTGQKGAANGICELDSDGKVPPSRVFSKTYYISSSETLTADNYAGATLMVMSSSNATLTIPTHATKAYPIGTEIKIVRYGTGAVTIAGATGVTVYSSDPVTSIPTQYASVGLKKLQENVWLFTGLTSSSIIKVNVGTVSSLPTTINSSMITADMELIRAELGTPTAQADDWSVTTANGSVTISGTVVANESTTLILYLSTVQATS